MTEFMPGDVVETDQSWISGQVGFGKLVVLSVDRGMISIKGNPKNGTSAFNESKEWFYDASYFRLVHRPSILTVDVPANTSTVTLKFPDGTTGDVDVSEKTKKVPEWIKDGAFCVHKKSGHLYRLRGTGNGMNFDVMSSDHEASTRGSGWCYIEDEFRPFEDSDWKWGMKALYRRPYNSAEIEVFVTSSIGENGKVSFTYEGVSWSHTTPSRLTPIL